VQPIDERPKKAFSDAKNKNVKVAVLF